MQNLAIFMILDTSGGGLGVASGLDREGKIAAIGPDHEVDSRMHGRVLI